MKLIGFNGSMGVGKSTAISVLKDALHDTIYTNPPAVKLLKFAQPLYDMQEFIYRRISSVVQRDENFTKDRKLLQWLGTEWGRDTISQTLWVDIWQQAVKSYHAADPYAIIVCDDVRFDNEAQVLKDLGGTIVKITSSHTEKRIDTKAGISNHASEAGIDPKFIDFTVENNGTMLEFMGNVDRLYKEFGFLPNNQRSK